MAKALQNLYPYLYPASLLEAFQIAISFFTLLFASGSAEGQPVLHSKPETRQYYIKLYNCYVVVHSSRRYKVLRGRHTDDVMWCSLVQEWKLFRTFK